MNLLYCLNITNTINNSDENMNKLLHYELHEHLLIVLQDFSYLTIWPHKKQRYMY